MAQAKIGTRTLDSQRGPFILWDTEVKGFHARRRTTAGKITFAFRYTDAVGRKREVKLGLAGAITADDARAAAKVEAGKVARNDDPAASRDAARAEKTVGEAWADYERLTMSKACKPRVQDNFRSLWNNYLAPHFADKQFSRIAKRQVEELHTAITIAGPIGAICRFLAPAKGYRKGARGSPRRGGATAANHAIELLSIVWNDAEQPNNPCARVSRNKGRGRDIVFSDTELSFILAALDEAPAREQIAIGLFLESANRHQTVAAAEWDEFVDLDPKLTNAAPHWLVFGSKLKGGRAHATFISPFLAAQILALKEETHAASPRYLFPFGEGKKNGAATAQFDPARPRATLDSVWARIKARAIAMAEAAGAECRALKLGTIHVFKHTYLTRFAELGASAVEIQQAGDHTDIRTSMKYVKARGERMAALQGAMADRLPRARAA